GAHLDDPGVPVGDRTSIEAPLRRQSSSHRRAHGLSRMGGLLRMALGNDERLKGSWSKEPSATGKLIQLRSIESQLADLVVPSAAIKVLAKRGGLELVERARKAHLLPERRAPGKGSILWPRSNDTSLEQPRVFVRTLPKQLRTGRAHHAERVVRGLGGGVMEIESGPRLARQTDPTPAGDHDREKV